MLNTENRQLSEYLKSLSALKQVNLPSKGWVRAIRDGLSMSRRQLANRLGLSTSRIQRLEQDEVSGAVTIKTMRRTAEALDCVFVYALLPRESLEATLKTQALKKAKQHRNEVMHSMFLEDQVVKESANQYLLESLTDQFMNKSSRTLWDDKKRDDKKGDDKKT